MSSKILEKYTRIGRIGTDGKEGKTYLVHVNKGVNKGNKYAMKTFRKSKSSDKLRTEVRLQKIAAKAGITPNVIDYNTNKKYIVMTRMTSHLVDKMNNTLTLKQQRQIIKLFKKLDKVGAFREDGNLHNYMYKGTRMYLIDYGTSKDITISLKKRLGTDTPNVTILTLGIVLKLKKMGCSSNSYNYLSKFLSKNHQKMIL